jgi:hypothetical protein
MNGRFVRGDDDKLDIYNNSWQGVALTRGGP